MKRIREIKRAALESIDGHWGWAILPVLICSGISAAISMPMSISSIMSNPMLNNGALHPSFGSLLLNTGLTTLTVLATVFLIYTLSVGMDNCLKLLYRDGDIKTVPNMFRISFGEGRYWRNVGAMLLVALFKFLWTLLFVVPGIVKSYAYALTPYILDDNPQAGPNEARLLSIRMMRGHKWKLFVMDLSFIGWALLCILSLFIGFIWLTPYYRTSRAAFYQEVLADWNASQQA